MKTINKITGKIKEYFKANFYAMAFAFKSSSWMYVGSLLLSFFINLIPIASVFVWERTVNGFLEPMQERIFDNAAARYLTVYLLLMIVLVFANHIYDWMKNKMSNIVRHTVEMAKSPRWRMFPRLTLTTPQIVTRWKRLPWRDGCSQTEANP